MRSLLIAVSLVVFLLQSDIILGQENVQGIRIAVLKETIKITGSVKSENDKEFIIRIVEKHLGHNPDVTGISVFQWNSGFHFGWESDFEKVLSEFGRERRGLISFQRKIVGENGYEPRLPESILNADIYLHSNGKIRLSEIPQKNIVLLLGTSWAVPTVAYLPALNKVREDYSVDELRILYLNVDDDETERRNFPNYLRKHQLKFESGWIMTSFVKELLDISGFAGIPQVFILSDEKVVGIFKGSSPSEIKRMETKLDSLLISVP